jgi:hypothetical protein
MTQIADQRAIVSVDPGSRGLAFVFFERGTLLDWGTRRRDGDELALLDQLLDRCNAEVLVLEDVDAARSERRPRVRRLLRLMARHAAERGISVQTVSRYDVRQAWSARRRSSRSFRGYGRSTTGSRPAQIFSTPSRLFSTPFRHKHRSNRSAKARPK